jgi:hypothetical protein
MERVMKKFFSRILRLIKDKERIVFWCIYFVMILFRIWLITGIPKMLIFLPHDDLYFAKAAHFIIHSKWMGPYDQLTLIKGPFYAFFLIGSFLTGLPLYLNETLFYIGACILLFFAVDPLIQNKWWRLICFAVVLYTPASLATAMHIRVYREFVYYALTLYVTSFSIGLMLRIKHDLSRLWLWSLGLGVSMGAFMLTREEGIWIYPVLFALLLFCIIHIWIKIYPNKILRTIQLIIPVFVWYIPILLVSYLNFTHYGYWGVTEQLEKEFNRVLSTQARIETNAPWHPAIQIPKEDRLAAYEVSPTLNQFKDTIESSIDGWNYHDDLAMAAKPDWYLNQYGDGGSEIGVHYLWMFRDVMAYYGYYSDGSYPEHIYRQIADELEVGCSSGEVVCEPKSPFPAIVGSIDKRHIPIITRMFFENLYHSVNQDLVNIVSLDISNWPAWPEGNDEYWFFESLIYNPVDTIKTTQDENLPKIINGSLDLRFRILDYKETYMRNILKIYSFFSLPAFILALIGWLALILTNLFKKQLHHWINFTVISSFVLGLMVVRLLILSIISATSSISGIIYGASAQIFSPIFTIIIFTWGFNQYREIRNERQKAL